MKMIKLPGHRRLFGITKCNRQLCLEGTNDNSPAFQRWVGLLFRLDQPSLRDFVVRHHVSSVELPGYFRSVPSGQNHLRTASCLLWISIFAVSAAAAVVSRAADFEIKNEAEFKKIIPVGAKIEKLAGGFKFTEGPVWIPGKPGYLVFSDIPANHLLKWSKEMGVTIFRDDSHSANGNTIDLKNHLLSAEHSGRRVSITGEGGEITTLVAEFEGKKFNSPNDVVVKSDGTVWFTDPDYGLGSNRREIDGKNVYRFDPKTQSVTELVKDFDQPNGLCFSPDEKTLRC